MVFQGQEAFHQIVKGCDTIENTSEFEFYASQGCKVLLCHILSTLIFISIAGMLNIINFKELRIQELCLIDKLEFLLFTLHSQAIICISHNVFSLQFICTFTVALETNIKIL